MYEVLFELFKKKLKDGVSQAILMQQIDAKGNGGIFSEIFGRRLLIVACGQRLSMVTKAGTGKRLRKVGPDSFDPFPLQESYALRLPSWWLEFISMGLTFLRITVQFFETKTCHLSSLLRPPCLPLLGHP